MSATTSGIYVLHGRLYVSGKRLRSARPRLANAQQRGWHDTVPTPASFAFRSRRLRRAQSLRSDSALSATGRQEAITSSGLPEIRESRYCPAPADPDHLPLKVYIQVRLVDGAEGKRLRAQQAAAIREALRWFATHRQEGDDRDEQQAREDR